MLQLQINNRVALSFCNRPFNQIYFLERACQAQVQALAGGQELRFPSEAVCELTAQQSDDEIDQHLHQLAWQSALRLIDGDSLDYRA